MKKGWIIAVLVFLACLTAVGGTMAWLTDRDEAENTFTVGSVAIALSEPLWPGADVRIYPGAVIGKDPTVTVEAKSEDCFVYVWINNELNNEVANAAALNVDTAHWTLVKASGCQTLYRYCDVVRYSEQQTELEKVFTKVTVDKDAVTEANIGLLNGKAIRVKAYAHQSNAIERDDADEKAAAFFSMT